MSQNITTTQTSTTTIATQTSTTPLGGTMTSTSATTAINTITVKEPKTLEHEGSFIGNLLKSNKIYICNHSSKTIVAIVTEKEQSFFNRFSIKVTTSGAEVSFDLTKLSHNPLKRSISPDKENHKIPIRGSEAFVSIFIPKGPDEFIMVFENQPVQNKIIFNVKNSHINAALETNLTYKPSEFKSNVQKSS